MTIGGQCVSVNLGGSEFGLLTESLTESSGRECLPCYTGKLIHPNFPNIMNKSLELTGGKVVS